MLVEGGYISYCGGVSMGEMMGGQDTPEQGMTMGGM
jgi:hypothetical protein